MEQKQNDTENKKVHGEVVKYGSVIQVSHPIFGTYVSYAKLEHVLIKKKTLQRHIWVLFNMR